MYVRLTRGMLRFSFLINDAGIMLVKLLRSVALGTQGYQQLFHISPPMELIYYAAFPYRHLFRHIV